MEYEQFEEFLKQINLKKGEFAELVSMNSNSVSNWRQAGKVPHWVKSWLENYIKAKDLDRVADAVAPILRNREG